MLKNSLKNPLAVSLLGMRENVYHTSKSKRGDNIKLFQSYQSMVAFKSRLLYSQRNKKLHQKKDF